MQLFSNQSNANEHTLLEKLYLVKLVYIHFLNLEIHIINLLKADKERKRVKHATNSTVYIDNYKH